MKTVEEKEAFVKKICIDLIPTVANFLGEDDREISPDHIEISGNIALALMGAIMFSVNDMNAMQSYIAHWVFNFNKLYQNEVKNKQGMDNAANEAH